MGRLLGLARVLAVVLVPMIDFRVSSGSWLAFCYVPLLLLSSGAFVLASYGLLPILLLYVRPGGEGFEPFWAYNSVYVTPHQAFTLLQFLLVLAFALDGNLWPDRIAGSRRERLLAHYGGAIRGWLGVWCWLLVAAMCLRDAPLYELAAWVAILLYARRQVPQSEVRTTVRTRVGEIVLGILSVVLFLVVLEAGARILFEAGRPTGGLYAADPEALFTLSPGATSERSFTEPNGEVVAVSFEISSQGLRDRYYGPKSDDEFRILLLGDSFTMGYATPLDASLSRTLERLLADVPLGKHVTVINGGVGGYGPWQERVFLCKRGFPLQPDLVINQLFLSNDVDNTLARIGKHQRAYAAGGHNQLLLRICRRLWQVRLNRWLEKHSRFFEHVQTSRGDDALLPHWSNRVRFLPQLAYGELPPSEHRPPAIEVDLEEWYPELREGVDLLVDDVAGIMQDCRERGIDFASFSLPVGSGMTEELWRHATGLVQDGSRYERGKGVRVVRERLEQEGVSCFDVIECMRPHAEDEKLYYLNDGHLTPRGCEVLAQCIKDYLMTEYLPAKGLLEAPPDDVPPEVERAPGS